MAEKPKASKKDSSKKQFYDVELNAVRILLDDEFKTLFDRKPELAVLAQILKNKK